MTTVERSVDIAAHPEDIEAYARYAESWPEWFPGVRNVAIDDQYPDINSQAEVSFEAVGMTFDLMLTVLDYIPGELVSYAISGMANGEMSFGIAEDDGLLYVDAIIDYELPGGVLGQIADRTVVERRVAESVEQALRNMKAGLES